MRASGTTQVAIHKGKPTFQPRTNNSAYETRTIRIREINQSSKIGIGGGSDQSGGPRIGAASPPIPSVNRSLGKTGSAASSFYAVARLFCRITRAFAVTCAFVFQFVF